MDRMLIIRTILLIIVALNVFLGYLGIKLPVDDAAVADLVDASVILISAVVIGWGYWKNNSWTIWAKIGDSAKDMAKSTALGRLIGEGENTLPQSDEMAYDIDLILGSIPEEDDGNG